MLFAEKESLNYTLHYFKHSSYGEKSNEKQENEATK